MHFRKLVTPVVIAVAASVIAFIGLGIAAAHLRDAESLSSERKVVGRTIAAVHEQLGVLAEDNAWWDIAVDHIVLEEDIGWIDETLGESVAGVSNIQGVLVLRGDGRVIYSRSDGKLPPPHVMLDAGFDRLPTQMAPGSADTPSTLSGLMEVEGRLLAFGASRVVPGGIKHYETPMPASTPVIVFVGDMSPGRLASIGSDNAIRNLTYLSARETDPGLVNPIQSHLGVTDPFGGLIGQFGWVPARPGMRLARDMVVPALLLLTLVALSMAYFVRRAGRLVDELAQANRSKSAFLASMSHEIRTPLNAILGFTELVSLELYGKVEGKKNKEYLKLIRDSGQHLLAIINDILDMSKLEAGRYDVYDEDVQAAGVAAASLKYVEASASERRIKLQFDCEEGMIRTDERIMRQVLLNILSNAIKFTDAGGQVTIIGRRIDDAGYRIEIKDTGCGMKQEDINLALTVFGQVQNEYARSHRGTGLGLPLVSRFMAVLDGDMHIGSKPGIGTTVSLVFPARVKAKNLPD
ncbi:MAG: hypothetical protein EP335_09520 [Alphaproteobacteria bacterium]|nr:MAG: hypothetical protein EP335_09520 [Alphaproteobacteria bacterium]